MAWPFSRDKKQTEAKQHPTGAAFMVGGGVQYTANNNRDAFIRHGYQQNVVVYRAIREVVEAAKSIKIELCSDDDVLKEHPALDLLHQPNPWQAYESWLSEMLVNRMLFGETFCVGTPEGQFAEMWALNPVDMEVEPGKHGLPLAYCHKRGKSKTDFKVDQVTGESDEMYLKTYNRSN